MAQAGISANRLELLQIADAVAREKSIDRKIVIAAMEDAIQKAAKARYGSENDLRCEIDKYAEIKALIDVPAGVTSQSRHSLLLQGSPPSGKLLIPLERRDGRVVEGARLEIDSARVC